MTPLEVLFLAIDALTRANIDYMLTGSFVSNYYSTPRTTQDADIVIQTNRKNLENFINQIKKEFYVDKAYSLNTLSKKSMFNIIHFNSGFKIDLIIRKNTPFEKIVFNRRNIESIHNRKIPISTPEDIILSKLLWHKNSDSLRQYEDAQQVLLYQRDNLDYDYLNKWALELGVEEPLKEIISRVEDFFSNS
jgi:hypothetical protein